MKIDIGKSFKLNKDQIITELKRNSIIWNMMANFVTDTDYNKSKWTDKTQT